MIHVEYFTVNSFQTRCSLVWDDNGNCAIIDPGYEDAERNEIVAFIESKKLTPVCAMLTHGHFDHIYGLAHFISTYNVPIYMDCKEFYTFEHTNTAVCGNYGLPLPQLPDYSGFQEGNSPFRNVADGDIIQVGDLRFEVLQTPGHSVGGLCFLERESRILFCGDTLFAGAIGRTDHPGGDYDQMMKSIWEKIMCLDGDISVIPGHGPETDVATERMTNPFLLPFNEPYEE